MDAHATADANAQLLLLHLMQEKERLITEKEELVDSKDKLWRGYHEIIQEKDGEIERLRKENRVLVAENERVKKKAQELALALQTLMEEEEEEDDSEDEERNAKWDHDAKAQMLEQAQDLTDGHLGQAKRSWLISNEDRITKVDNASTSQPRLSATSRAPMMQQLDSSIIIPPIDQNHNRNIPTIAIDFNFAPLIRTDDDGKNIMGKTGKLAPQVLSSIKSTIKELKKRHAEGSRPPFPSQNAGIRTCAWLYAMDRASEIRWTIESPTNFACYSCFNARRACLLWMGDLKWLVLPLPLQVRNQQCSWTQAAYYIYPDDENAVRFPDVWKASKKKTYPKKSKKRMLAEIEE